MRQQPLDRRIPARQIGHTAILVAAALTALPSSAGCAQADAPPFSIAPGLFEQGKADLGLHDADGTETFTVFAPSADTDKFSNGAVLIGFRHRLYVQWQSSARDEDSPDTWVAYSVSDDGETWSAPAELAAAGDGIEMHSSGGWWTDGETLVAYVNVWPTGFQSHDGGYTEYRLSTDGQSWSESRRVTGKGGAPVEGIIEQDPHEYDGRLYTAFHLRPGLIAKPHYTDDPLGIGGWVEGAMRNLPYEPPTSRELEPSLFRRGACLVMVFRDQASSFHGLAAESCDRGETWSTPVLTNMPDARAKQSAGNLPDGTAYIVNAPLEGSERIPLAVTLSDDGRVFERSFLLRGAADLPPLRYEGRYKRPGYHYPKSIVAGGFLYVAYATNKEDVQVTRVPLSALGR
jgi:BNR repeat-like domain